jgi:hypothetical protein
LLSAGSQCRVESPSSRRTQYCQSASIWLSDHTNVSKFTVEQIAKVKEFIGPLGPRVHGGWMMSGTIVFAEGTDWTASSGIFNWVIDYLARTVDDESTREALRVIDEQNFRWLNLADLSETGRREVLSKLADGIVTYSEEKLPETAQREDALATVGELAELARAILSNRK